MLDVLIPTGRKRLSNCVFQIHAALSSSVDVRVIVLMSQPWPELYEALSFAPTGSQTNRLLFIEDSPDGIVDGGIYNPAGLLGLPHVKFALENLELSEWFGYFHDDDALLPWGIKHLMDATEGVSMVVGRALGVSRAEHLDFTPYQVGKTLDRCRVSNACAIYKTADLKSLPKPWFFPEYIYADWELINRMARKFPYKIIPNTVQVLSLYELEHLPLNFRCLVEHHNAPERSKDLVESACDFGVSRC